MDISIIIITRNTCAQTVEAVTSVLDSQGSFSRQVLVIDNGSTDQTASILPEKFPEIIYRRFEQNLGFARAVNLAAQEATGEFLLLLNSDARLGSVALAAALDWMRTHPECGVAGAQLLHSDGSRQNSIANFPSLATELLNKSMLRRLWPSRFPGKERIFSEPLPVESVIGAFLLTRKKLWDRLRGLDERFFFFLEETDFCLRAKQAGLGVFHLPQVQVWHGQGQSANQTRAAARVEYWRSRYAYFRKHHGLGTRLALCVGLNLRLLIDTLASGLAVGATFGTSSRWRNKFAVCRALLIWHCRGCPGSMGLPR